MNGSYWQPPYYQPNVYMPDPKTIEKENLKKTSNRVWLSLIWFFAAQLVVVVMFEVILMVCDPSIITEGFSSTAYFLLTGVSYPLLLLIPLFILCKQAKVQLNDLVPVQKVGKRKTFSLFLVAFAAAMVAQLVIVVLNINLSAIGITNEVANEITPTKSIDFVMMFLCTAVFPAILEELLFRGAILGLLKKHGDGFAIIVSSILFGLMHGNFVQIPFAFLGGLIFAYVTIYTKSIIPAMILHFANNFLSVILQTLQETIVLPGGQANDILIAGIDYGLMLVALIIGLVAFYHFTKNNPKAFVFESSKGNLTFKEKIKYSLTGVPAILSWIIYIGMAIIFILAL